MTTLGQRYDKYNELVDRLNGIDITNSEELIAVGRIQKLFTFSRGRLTTICKALDIEVYRRGAHRARYYKKSDVLRIINYITNAI